MKRSSFFLTACVAAAIAASAIATHGTASHLWPPDAASARDAGVAPAPPTGCGAPTDDEVAPAGDDATLGTNAVDSARADFDRKAAALTLTARERVARRADAAAVAVPETLIQSLLISCRYGELAQKRTVSNLVAFSNGTRHWRSAGEMRFFVYIGLAEAAVEARGVGDTATIAKIYAAIEPEIPLATVHGQYHTMHWPA